MIQKKPDWVFRQENDTRGIIRRLGKGLSARIFAGDHVMLSFVSVEPHSEGKVHSHPEEQWGVLLKGECVRIQAGEEHVMHAGDFWHTPGNVPHGIRTTEKGATILDIFSPPRPEYRKPEAGRNAMMED